MRKILIVDDDPICLELIKTLLTNDYHCEVDVVESAEDALYRIYKMVMEWNPKWYDLILMDINLPILNGDAVTKIIKETESQIKHIPVIAITSSQISDLEQSKFLEMGIGDVVKKPVTNEKLAAILKKYLNI
jgi:CheY-like chemotaxis protein